MRRSLTFELALALGVCLLFVAPEVAPRSVVSAQASPQMDVVLEAEDANTYRVPFSVVPDSTASGGYKMTSTDEGWSSFNAPPTGPLAPFALYSIHVPAPGAYRLWLRMRGQGDSKWNESVWVQFSDATQNDVRVFRIGSDDGLLVNLEDCSACGMQGWGWQDNAWWLSQSSIVTLPQGAQELLLLVREDGVEIDQIVLSPARYMNNAPGTTKNDVTTRLRSEVIMGIYDVTALNKMFITEDAAGYPKISSTDAGWSSTDRVPADPTAGGYADFVFDSPQPGPYHLWMRLRGQGDSKWNESVWVQFSNATVNGAPAYRLGTADGLLINLENCYACGVQGWGWQDGAWWLNQSAVVTLPAGRVHLRILVREDGVEFDQVVLSPSRFMGTSPGQLKNDTHLVAHIWY